MFTCRYARNCSTSKVQRHRRSTPRSASPSSSLPAVRSKKSSSASGHCGKLPAVPGRLLSGVRVDGVADPAPTAGVPGVPGRIPGGPRAAFPLGVCGGANGGCGRAASLPARGGGGILGKALSGAPGSGSSRSRAGASSGGPGGRSRERDFRSGGGAATGGSGNVRLSVLFKSGTVSLSSMASSGGGPNAVGVVATTAESVA